METLEKSWKARGCNERAEAGRLARAAHVICLWLPGLCAKQGNALLSILHRALRGDWRGGGFWDGFMGFGFRRCEHTKPPTFPSFFFIRPHGRPHSMLPAG